MAARLLHSLLAFQVAASLSLLLYAGCHRLSPAEKKVLGDWKTVSIGGETVTTFRADHTWTSVGGCLDVTLHGRWRVDGSEVVYWLDRPAIDDLPALQPIRQPIQRLIDDDREARRWLAQIPKK